MWFWVKPEPPEKNVDRETALEDEDINVIMVGYLDIEDD